MAYFCAVADSRYRGRGQSNDVGTSSAANVSKPTADSAASSNVPASSGQSSQGGTLPPRQSGDPSRMRNGPIGGSGKTASSGKIQNGQ